MAKERLGNATFVERGYGQVEPNHLSAQRTGQIYAQLPVKANITLLENGQFVKYDYANEEVNFTGKGEWMLVFNEVKVYREWESDCDFAMIRDNYVARVYSPIDGTLTGVANGQQLTQPRYYGGTAADGSAIPKVTTPADPYEWDSTDNPFAAEWDYKGPKKMPENTKMVPRVFKTNVGDIYTTNCVKETTLEVGNELTPGADGYLVKVASGENAATPDMVWEVVKVYDLGDRQKAVKLMRTK
jgi:hypothetical protein